MWPLRAAAGLPRRPSLTLTSELWPIRNLPFHLPLSPGSLPLTCTSPPGPAAALVAGGGSVSSRTNLHGVAGGGRSVGAILGSRWPLVLQAGEGCVRLRALLESGVLGSAGGVVG